MESVLYERSRSLLLLYSDLNSYFEEVFLMNFISIYSNLLNHILFVHFLLIEDYEEGALRKKPVIAPFVEQFKIATLRKSSR